EFCWAFSYYLVLLNLYWAAVPGWTFNEFPTCSNTCPLYAIKENPSLMKIFSVYIILLSFTTSCSFGVPESTKEEKLKVFQESKFDKGLLNDLSSYATLLNSILPNLDSIIKYDNGKEYGSKLDSIFHLIETGKLVISKEKGKTLIRFDINRYKRQNRIIECHFLYWHEDAEFEIKDNFSFFKDTTLDKNFVYRIGIATDNSGW
nr:hypothetical protein [Crocinitomicaceae bacterium]